MENTSPTELVVSPAASPPDQPAPGHQGLLAALPLLARKLHGAGGVFLVWVVANLLGVAAIGAIILVLPFLTSIRGMPVSSLVIGVPIAFAQWIVLRRLAPVSILWVLTISAGLILGIVLGPKLAVLWAFADDESVLALTAGTTTIGLFVGLIQTVFLRSQFPKSLVWPLSSAAGLGLGIVLVLVSNLIDESGLISINVVAVVYAMVTGLVVSWLSAPRKKTESPLLNAT
jgi:hypothetical protein